MDTCFNHLAHKLRPRRTNFESVRGWLGITAFWSSHSEPVSGCRQVVVDHHYHQCDTAILFYQAPGTLFLFLARLDGALVDVFCSAKDPRSSDFLAAGSLLHWSSVALSDDCALHLPNRSTALYHTSIYPTWLLDFRGSTGLS